MFPNNWPSGIYPSGDMTTTTNEAAQHFLEYDCIGGSGTQEEKPSEKKKSETWQEKTDKERDDNLRGLFGYD